MSEPAGIPNSAIGRSCAAITQPELRRTIPSSTRTNHGSATNVIDEPVSETSSAVIRPRIERFLHIVTIK